jgi:predicted DNA-binding protein (MmcQ/YjbR family)
MDIEALRNYCLAKPGTTESFPFDETTLVFKVMGKMFALTDLIENRSVNLKCDPEKAIQLRERYDAVQPGFHMSKNLWNTVNYDGIPDDKLIYEWIDHSYDQVVKGLPKKIRNQLNELNQ